MWQYLPSKINPIFFEIGPVQIRYYGLMYLSSILVVYFLLKYRVKKENTPYTMELLENYFFSGILGVLIGARLGYVLFYNFGYYTQNPLEIILPFSFSEGIQYTGISGLSYHGGLLGLLVSSTIFCRKHEIDFWSLADFIVPVAPLGYAFGRLGNFLNGELYGRVTSVPWGMYFPQAGNQLRHPSQLYEMFFEGLFLFVILWSLRNAQWLKGKLLALYLIGYGFVRFIIEYFREPDKHIGFVYFHLSMGQILCAAMILIGLTLMVLKKNETITQR